jgi:hypothetical protein
VNVNSNGPSGVGLTINIPSTTPVGNYTIMIISSWRGISRTLTVVVWVRTAAPAGITAAVSYWMNHQSLAESALLGLITLVPLLAIMSRSTADGQHPVSKSRTPHRTHSCSSSGFRQQDLVWLVRRA